MKISFILKNRESEFISALVLRTEEEHSYEECWNKFNDFLIEYNWYEEQTYYNALCILRELSFSFKGHCPGVMPAVGIFDYLKRNMFKSYFDEEDYDNFITFDLNDTNNSDLEIEIAAAEEEY